MTLPPPPEGFRGAWRTDDDARAVYAEAAGIARELPRAVARPADAASVQRLAAWAWEHALPLIARGSGSSMAGGAIGEGIVVDLGALDHIGAADRIARRIRAGAGALRGRVDAAARLAGLRFPVDPSSGEFCTVGGMASTNAAGARSLAFGAMRESVVALDCVFADGSRAEVVRGHDWRGIPALRRLDEALPQLRTLAAKGACSRPGVRKESSGYAVDAFLEHDDAVDLIVGSEGTLCLIVGVELALIEVPGATATILGAFSSLDEAVGAAVDARAAGATACELLDRTFLAMARAGGGADGVPADAEAVLLAEVEGSTSGTVRDSAAHIEALFRAGGASAVATAMEPVAEAELWELRHAASPSIARLHPHLRSLQFIEDGGVPPQRFAEYVRGVREILARHGIQGVIFGHAGDAHAHVNPLVDVAAPDWRLHVGDVLDEVTSLVTHLGGTLAAEHGDGRLRTPLLSRTWNEEATAAFQLVKAALDPAGLLNPGVKVPLPGQEPLGIIKYDPAAGALPPRAAAVLRRVEQRRLYARSRLELLEEADLETSSRSDGTGTAGAGLPAPPAAS